MVIVTKIFLFFFVSINWSIKAVKEVFKSYLMLPVLFGIHVKNRNSRIINMEASKMFQKTHLLSYNLAFSLSWLLDRFYPH